MFKLSENEMNNTLAAKLHQVERGLSTKLEEFAFDSIHLVHKPNLKRGLKMGFRSTPLDT